MSDSPLIAAGGWCAPSEQVYDLSVAGDAFDGRVVAQRSSRSSFGALNFTDPLPPSRTPKPEPEPLPAAPDGAPAGHWEFGVVLPADEDADVAWSDWHFYDQTPNYRTPEEAREGEHYEPGAEIVRRWQPDPFPYEPHVPNTEENDHV